MPGDRPAPIMTDDNSLRGIERVKHADHIAHKVKEAVLIDVLRLTRLAIAAHIGRDRVEARLGQRFQLMAPRIPGFRKAVAEEHQGPASGFGQMNGDAIRLD